MDKLVYLYYPLLLLLLFFGTKVIKKGEWNDEVLSFRQTKAFLGFAAVVIVFHHISHKTCAPWLSPHLIRHGFDVFVYVGYLCVAAFFFCSGYGMMTACTKKEDFFKGYIKRHILPILCPAVVIWLVFFIIERLRGVRVERPYWINVYDYVWYIPVILCMYVMFYLSFCIIKDRRRGMITLWAGTVIYIILAMLFSPGTWWFNTVHLFPVGAGFALKHEKRIEALKKGYIPKILLFFLLTIVFFAVANYYPVFTAMARKPYNRLVHVILEGPGQMISAYTFVMLIILLGLKLRIGNRVLDFFGAFTLELYLVHPLFVQIFCYAFVKDGNKPILYIKEPFIYVLAVFALSIPIARLFKRRR